MKMIQITDAAYDRLQKLIASADQDSGVPRAYSETDMLALALIALDYLMHSNPQAPIQMVLNVMVMKFEVEKAEQGD